MPCLCHSRCICLPRGTNAPAATLSAPSKTGWPIPMERLACEPYWLAINWGAPSPSPPPQVTFKRRRHYLGMHGSEEAAARAYDQGAICLLVGIAAGGGEGAVIEGIGGLSGRGGVLQARGKARAWCMHHQACG